MRIARFMTVTDVTNIINEYFTTYVITDEELNAVLNTPQGLIRRLVTLLGIDSNKVPVLCLYTEDKPVPHGSWTKLIWDAKIIDNLDAWNPEKPAEFKVTKPGIYDATVYVKWALNEVGHRKVWLYTYTPYIIDSVVPAVIDAATRSILSFVAPFEEDDEAWVYVVQNSGGELYIEEALFTLHRRALMNLTY